MPGKRTAGRYDENGLPRDGRDWTEADWRTLWEHMRAVITDVYELEKSETVTHLNLDRTREEQILVSKRSIANDQPLDQNIELLYHNSGRLAL